MAKSIMGNNELVFDDDHVAGLLANEAQDDAVKYSAIGLAAYRPNKK